MNIICSKLNSHCAISLALDLHLPMTEIYHNMHIFHDSNIYHILFLFNLLKKLTKGRRLFYSMTLVGLLARSDIKFRKYHSCISTSIIQNLLNFGIIYASGDIFVSFCKSDVKNFL